MTSNLLQRQPTHLTVNVLLENDHDGRVIATVLNIPNCRVTAETREQALTQLYTLLSNRFETSEVVSLDIPLLQPTHPWMQYAGVFKDDPHFDVVQQYIQDYRHELDTLESKPEITEQESA
jgi:predicted RNase H-like HicB family nuclease